MPDPMAANRALVLYHCRGARSFRALWALEELERPYRLHMLPFPPRYLEKTYLEVNPLGTIPFLVTENGTGMSESAGIVEYLVTRYGPSDLAVPAEDPEYPRYLNFLHMSDATLTFPQTLYLRYTQLERPEKRIPQVAEDYRRWFLGRLQVALTMFGGDYCCGARFTAADIAVGYAIKLARGIGLRDDLPAAAQRYFERLEVREGYRRAMSAERQPAALS